MKRKKTHALKKRNATVNGWLPGLWDKDEDKAEVSSSLVAYSVAKDFCNRLRNLVVRLIMSPSFLSGRTHLHRPARVVSLHCQPLCHQ